MAVVDPWANNTPIWLLNQRMRLACSWLMDCLRLACMYSSARFIRSCSKPFLDIFSKPEISKIPIDLTYGKKRTNKEQLKNNKYRSTWPMEKKTKKKEQIRIKAWTPGPLHFEFEFHQMSFLDIMTCLFSCFVCSQCLNLCLCHFHAWLGHSHMITHLKNSAE